MKIHYTIIALAVTPLASQAAITTVGGEIDNDYAGLFSRYTTASLTDGADGANSWANVSTVGAGTTLANNQGDVTIQAGGVALNNQNYVDFDGSSSIWGGADVTGGKYTVSFVLRIDADTNGYVFDGTTGTQRGALFAGSGGNETGWTMYGGASAIDGTDFAIGEWQIHTVVYDAGVTDGSKHYINGALAYQGTLASVTTFQSMIVGARVNNANKLDGGIAEIMIHNEALSESDVFAVQGALSSTYGIAVPEPSSSALLGLGGLALILRRRK